MSEGTKLAEKVDLETTPEDAIPCTNSFQDCPLAFRVTSPEKNQDTITCSMSKIGIEPIRSMFGIAACVFQMVDTENFEIPTRCV